MFQVSERIFLTLWVGGMWISGFVVAPMLFSMLEDRALAGTLAGQLFTIMSFIGLAVGTLLIIGVLVKETSRAFLSWRFWTLLGMLLIVIVGQFVLQPMMTELRTAGLSGENAAKFAQLHGTASALFTINSLAGLVLVIAGVQMKAVSLD